MTSTDDRQLLELAAKAANLHVLWDEQYECLQMSYKPGYSFEEWNPLTDDGDALRLAVKLRMSFHFEDQNGQECIEVQHSHNEESGECKCVLEPLLFDANAAARLSITRAAAEIGRAMS